MSKKNLNFETEKCRRFLSPSILGVQVLKTNNDGKQNNF